MRRVVILAAVLCGWVVPSYPQDFKYGIASSTQELAGKMAEVEGTLKEEISDRIALAIPGGNPLGAVETSRVAWFGYCACRENPSKIFYMYFYERAIRGTVAGPKPEFLSQVALMANRKCRGCAERPRRQLVAPHKGRQ